MTLAATPRLVRLCTFAAIVGVLTVSGSIFVLLSHLGEQRRCDHLTRTHHKAAAVYCPTTSGVRLDGEGRPTPDASPPPAVVAPQPRGVKASRSRGQRGGLPASGSHLSTTCYVASGNRTASGVWPQAGMAASNRHPFGTRLLVEGVGVVTVTDRIGHSSELDIFMADRAACLQFGRQMLHVAVVR